MNDLQFPFVFKILILTLIHSTSLDCPNIVNLGKGLGIQYTQPAMWTLLQNDCCSATGIICSSGLVTEIQWQGLGLNEYQRNRHSV
jgi:hypothetical protein